MKLATGDGICCCICGSIHKQKFQYYSYDRYLRPANSVTSLYGQLGPVENSVDLCRQCHENVVKHVLLNNSEISKSKIQPGKFCELTGENIDNIKYYLYKIALVSVDLDIPDVHVDANYLHFFSLVDNLEQFAKL